jgi:acetylornithine deacetylase/succinyl-diaminopimelate desuccinylase-like protein
MVGLLLNWLGRGGVGADDGYALFAALGAILALGDLGIPFPSCRILIEASEESGSPDLPAYLADAEVGSYLGTPDAVICLDSGCKTYDQLWLTTSLRGLISATLRVGVLAHSVHSGDAGGIVPSPHRIMRMLLARIEDATTGDILLPELHTTPSADTRQTVQETHEAVSGQIYRTFPFLPGVCPANPNVRQLILSNIHLPTLEVIGVEGVPGLDGGNAIAPWIAHKLSLRLPPTCDVHTAAEALHKALTENPPYGAQISCTIDSVSPGWSGRRLTPNLEEVLTRASYFFYRGKLACMGEGAGIPFVNMMATRFPEATLVVTGLLGPESNAHGPNEMLHIPAAKALTGSMAVLLASLAVRQTA